MHSIEKIGDKATDYILVVFAGAFTCVFTCYMNDCFNMECGQHPYINVAFSLFFFMSLIAILNLPNIIKTIDIKTKKLIIYIVFILLAFCFPIVLIKLTRKRKK